MGHERGHTNAEEDSPASRHRPGQPEPARLHLAPSGRLSTTLGDDAEDPSGLLGVVVRSAGSPAPVRLAPSGPLLVTSLSASRQILTNADSFSLPYDVRRRSIGAGTHGSPAAKDTVHLTPDAVRRGLATFVAELPDLATLGAEVDALRLLRDPVARSTTDALLPGLVAEVRDRVADLVLAWVDSLAPVISADRSPRPWERVRRIEGRAWKRLVRAVAATGRSDADSVATALAAGVQVPIAAGAWAIVLLAEVPSTRERVRDEPGLAPSFVWETLRLYPPTWLIGRVSTTDVTLDGMGVSPYTPVVVCPVVLGRDPHLVPGPPEGFAPLHRVDPSRWFDSDAKPGAWLPFGGGAHACPGRNLGLAQLTALVEWAAPIDLAPTGPRGADTSRGLAPAPSSVSVTPPAESA